MPTLAACTDVKGGSGVNYFELLAHRAQGPADVVTLRERKACSLIAPPILGRAITDARSYVELLAHRAQGRDAHS